MYSFGHTEEHEYSNEDLRGIVIPSNRHFPNSLIQYANAIRFSMAVKSICWIVIRQKAWFLPDFFSVRLDGREISVFNGRKEKNVPIPELDNSPCLEVRGSFFYDYTLSPWYSKIEMSRHEGISKFSSHVLESIFNIESDKGESEVESKHLHIHIRSGDIFPGGGLHADIPNPKYGQPPLSFCPSRL